MKRLFTAATCALLVAALAAPALADHKIGGYYRVQGIMQNYSPAWTPGSKGPQKDRTPDKFVDQRIRMKWTNNINEYVSTVWYVEADMPWGEKSKGGIGGGGQRGADGVNVETKNAFADVKIPETPVAMRIGMQGWGDNFNGAIYNEDMAGLKVDIKAGPGNLLLFWSKWYERGADYTGTRAGEDDTDLYWAEYNMMVNEAANVGFTAAFANSQNVGSPGKNQVWNLGIDGGLKTGVADLSGWFIYQFGENDPGGSATKTDIAAYALALLAKGKVDAIKWGAGFTWYGADTDAKDDNSLNGGVGAFEFPRQGSQLFLADIYYNNGGGGRFAFKDAVYDGYGLIGLWANGSMQLPQMKGAYVKGFLGYFTATEDKVNKDDATKREGKSLGFEIGGQIGVKVAERADISLRGAYGILGSFYDKTDNGKDPDDLYNLALMLNIPM